MGIINGTESRKILFYSGHDVNIYALATIFNMTSYQCVKDQAPDNECLKVIEFASQFLFELNQDDETK